VGICTRKPLLCRNFYHQVPPRMHGHGGCPARHQESNSNGCSEISQPARPVHLARFVEDVTIQDGTFVDAGSKFVKTWRMLNEGSTAWPEGCKLTLVGGQEMTVGGISEVPVPKPPAPGESVEISVELVAPPRPGRYVSYWRLVDADGVRFGHRVWVDVVAIAPQEALAAPAVVAPAPAPVAAHIPAAKPVVPVQQPASETQAQEFNLQKLAELGFHDRDQNVELLRKHKGDLVKCVVELLE